MDSKIGFSLASSIPKKSGPSGRYRQQLNVSKRLQAPQQSILFVDLPAELRNRIYKLVLPSGQNYNLGSTMSRYHLNQSQSVLRMCRLIRDETIPIFAATNLFFFDDLGRLPEDFHLLWLEAMAPAFLKSVVFGLRLPIRLGESKLVRHDGQYDGREEIGRVELVVRQCTYKITTYRYPAQRYVPGSEDKIRKAEGLMEYWVKDIEFFCEKAVIEVED